MKIQFSSCQIKFIIYLLSIAISTIFADVFKCEKDGFFADKRDCWIYHICVGRTHTVKACKDDLLYNPMKNECDWAMNVNCNHTSPDDILPPTISTHTTLDVRISPSGNSSRASIFDYLCQSTENDYIAHPNDCKQYAYCANGVPQIKLCKKTLLWSQSEKMCVWPAQSDCPVKNSVPIISTASSENRDSPWISRDTTYPPSYLLTESSQSNVDKSSSICPSAQSRRLPDPYDCSMYHDCYHGTDLASYCPGQLQYNSQTNNCDLPQNVQCKNKCTVNNEGARFIDPRSCCHFYECISGKLIPQTCSHPNSFDIQTRKCLPYKKVKCDGRRACVKKCHYSSNVDVGKSSCDFMPSCAGHSDGFYLDRTRPNCQSYIQCLDHRVANQSRCPHDQRFNRNMGRCTSPDQVPCLAPTRSIRLSLIVSILAIIIL